MLNPSNSVKVKTLSDFSPFLQSTLLNPVAPAPQEGSLENPNYDDEDLVERMFEGIEDEDANENVVSAATPEATSGEKEVHTVIETTEPEPAVARDTNYVEEKPRKSSWLTKLCKCGGEKPEKERTKSKRVIDLRTIKQSHV
ncbi:unnamed protein product [Orchesella dallaii]|uniref:Uncharacterized protein n=1 Tax=Orchesella dallaii TaxID=48710 RepID=A0ABP1RHR1_9HEXA